MTSCCTKVKTFAGYSSIFCAAVCFIAGMYVTQAAMGSDQWVTTDSAAWGLFDVCVTIGNLTLQIEGTCDSPPGYYVAMRAFVYICVFVEFLALAACVFCCRICILVILLYVASALTPPVLLLTFYQDDDRWKDSDPSLGKGFWLFSVGQALSLPAVAVALYWYCDKDRRAGWGQALACWRSSSPCRQRCWSPCTESVSGCCDRMHHTFTEGVTARCARCVETVATCGTRCSAGLSSCCQGLAAKARLLLQGLGGLLAACCAPCRRGPTKAAGRPSPQDKQRRPHQQRVVLSKEQVWLLLKTLAHSKAAASPHTTAQCYHGDKAGFHGDVGCNDGHSESGTERERDRRLVEDHGRRNQFPKPEQNVWHTGASSIPEWTQRGVERQWVVNEYPETEQRMGHRDYRTKPKCDQTGIGGQWNINAGTTQKFVHTANNTNPEWNQGNVGRQWNRDQNPKTEQKLWHTGIVPKPEWCPRNVERQWKQDQCPKPEQELWHTQGRTKPECGQPSLSDLADPRVGRSLPDDVSESFV